MKITISYIPEEAQAADLILRFVRDILPGAKVRRSAAHPPQICVYLTAPFPRKGCGAAETT